MYTELLRTVCTRTRPAATSIMRMQGRAGRLRERTYVYVDPYAWAYDQSISMVRLGVRAHDSVYSVALRVTRHRSCRTPVCITSGRSYAHDARRSRNVINPGRSTHAAPYAHDRSILQYQAHVRRTCACQPFNPAFRSCPAHAPPFFNCNPAGPPHFAAAQPTQPPAFFCAKGQQ